MDQVEQIVDQLSGVLLAIATEAANLVAKGALQVIWRCATISAHPNLLHQDAKSFS